ncbi:hypothetical protein MAR_015737, partial [Mya arenaria]
KRCTGLLLVCLTGAGIYDYHGEYAGGAGREFGDRLLSGAGGGGTGKNRLPVMMLGIAFLCSSWAGLFCGTVRSRINPARLDRMARKQNAITVFISKAALVEKLETDKSNPQNSQPLCMPYIRILTNQRDTDATKPPVPLES